MPTRHRLIAGLFLLSILLFSPAATVAILGPVASA